MSLTLDSPDFAELKKFLTQLETLNNEYISFKSSAHLLKGKEKKFQHFIKKALDRLNEPYLVHRSNSKLALTQQSLEEERRTEKKPSLTETEKMCTSLGVQNKMNETSNWSFKVQSILS